MTLSLSFNPIGGYEFHGWDANCCGRTDSIWLYHLYGKREAADAEKKRVELQNLMLKK